MSTELFFELSVITADFPCLLLFLGSVLTYWCITAHTNAVLLQSACWQPACLLAGQRPVQSGASGSVLPLLHPTRLLPQTSDREEKWMTDCCWWRECLRCHGCHNKRLPCFCSYKPFLFLERKRPPLTLMRAEQRYWKHGSEHSFIIWHLCYVAYFKNVNMI